MAFECFSQRDRQSRLLEHPVVAFYQSCPVSLADTDEVVALEHARKVSEGNTLCAFQRGKSGSQPRRNKVAAHGIALGTVDEGMKS